MVPAFIWKEILGFSKIFSVNSLLNQLIFVNCIIIKVGGQPYESLI